MYTHTLAHPWSPIHVYNCAHRCSCFADTHDAHGAGAHGWSDLAVRARATSVVSTAVLYRAQAVLTRGRAKETLGELWVDGKDGDVGRYVRSDANRAQAAHLISGWKQDPLAGQALLLSSNSLTAAYLGHKPHWWLYSFGSRGAHGWSVLPNSVAGADAIPFWRDVCTSLCMRKHGDNVELVEVDLRKGLYEGHRSNTAPSTCDCYANDDMAKLNASTAAFADHTPSQAAPNDFAVLRFLETATLVNHYIGKHVGTDNGLHYRSYLNLYAVQRKAWPSHFVDTQQSSIFFERALEPGYTIDIGHLKDDENAYVNAEEGVVTREDCLRECAMHAGGTDVEMRPRQDVKTMVHDAVAQTCWCTTKNWLDPAHDDSIVHPPHTDANRPLVYRVQFCAGVSGGSSRSVVYRKMPAGATPLPVCHGMPSSAGMILSNGSIFFAQDPGSVTRPVDLQCRAACDANPDCAMAHSVRAHSPRFNTCPF